MVSEQFDYEGELVAVIGLPARHVAKADALDCVAGYSIFNDASVRDYQFKGAQWTPGKNFDRTGAFGPVFVTSDELPPGASGLRITTTLNGMVVQDSNTDQLLFDVATLVSLISDVLTLEPGDIIVTGTPAGVGMARTPKLWMSPGDVCEVDIEGIGRLRNPVKAEKTAPR
jgi:acylpyruvate hydrolase